MKTKNFKMTTSWWEEIVQNKQRKYWVLLGMVIYSVYKIYALNVKVQLQGRRVEKRYTTQIPIIIKVEGIYWY